VREKKYFVHESSYIDENVEIREGTKIWHFSHIQGGTRIGKNCSIGQNVNVGNNVVIGNNVKIQNNVSVYEGVFCGPSMVFTNILNPRSEFPQRGSEFYIKTLVKKSASLGANSTIICGHTIGEYAFVGAGAVVTKDVPDYALYIGNPAKIKGWMCKCGTKLNLSIDPVSEEQDTCPECGRKYRKLGIKVKEIL